MNDFWDDVIGLDDYATPLFFLTFFVCLALLLAALVLTITGEYSWGALCWCLLVLIIASNLFVLAVRNWQFLQTDSKMAILIFTCYALAVGAIIIQKSTIYSARHYCAVCGYPSCKSKVFGTFLVPRDLPEDVNLSYGNQTGQVSVHLCKRHFDIGEVPSTEPGDFTGPRWGSILIESLVMLLLVGILYSLLKESPERLNWTPILGSASILTLWAVFWHIFVVLYLLVAIFVLLWAYVAIFEIH